MMKKKTTNLLLIFLIALFTMPMRGISQTEQKLEPSCLNHEHKHDGKIKKCNCKDQHEAYWKAHPEAYQEYIRERSKVLTPSSVKKGNSVSRFFTNLFGSNSDDIASVEAKLPEKFIIPVVFHVFGKVQSGKTVTYEKVKKALQKTNEDFARMSEGQDRIHNRFKNVVGELPVEFRLAKIDPNGNICDGVNFYPAQSGFGNGSGYDSEIQKYAWDNYKYMNVYLMNDLYADNSSTNSGVAWYPSEHMSKNKLARVVYNGRYINGNTDENFRRIITHEFGHFFNLKHTFEGGCEEKDGGDECADTPAADRSKMGVDEQNCKGEYTNTQNFMNYTNDYEMFTKDQVARMTSAMQHPARMTLWKEENLEATGVTADFNPQNIITYANYEITEALINDGSIDSELKAVLTNVTDVEFKNEAFVLGKHFKMENLPIGLIPVLTRISATEVKVAFEGKTNLHQKRNSLKGISLEFLSAAFNKPVNEVWNHKINKFSIRFRDEYETKYLSIEKSVSGAGNWKYIDLSPVRAECYIWHYNEDPEKKFKLDMEIDKNSVLSYEGTPNIVPLNLGDEISSASSWYKYTVNGKQADIYNKNFSEWEGKRKYIGIQIHHDNDTYHGWLSASISANGETFTVHDGAYYTKPDATIQAGKAHRNILKFQGDTIFEDLINNNGSVENALSAKLMNCTFSVAENTVISAGTHYSITGLPAGFTEEITVLPNDYLSVKFKGYAERHNKADFSKVNIKFTDALFDGLKASEIKNADGFTVNVEFIDEYRIVYHDMDDITVDENATWKKFILGESENGFGAWVHKGNLRFESYERDVVGYTKSLNAKLLSKGTSIDSNTDAWITPGGFPDEMYLVDSEHTEWIGKEGYLGCVVNINDKRCYAWIRLEVDATGKSYTVKDWAYNEQPNAPIIAGEVSKSTKAIISVKNPEFVELYSNEGEVDGSAKINLLNDEFAFEKGAKLTQGTHFSIKNLPAGLRCNIEVEDENNLTVNFEGNAINHTRPESGDVSILLKDLVFVTNVSEKVENSTFDVKIKFKEPWDIIYTDIDDITVNENNTFKWFGMEVGSHGFGAWWYNKDDKIKFESYENYVVCVQGTDNLIPLTAGTLIGANSKEWYQGKDYPDEPDLDDNEYHAWRGKEAYVGVRLKNGEHNHYGWIRIAMAADAKSYTVLDHAFNDEPEAPIMAGQSLAGEKAVLDATTIAFKESYENDGSINGENFITVTNAKYSQSSGEMILGTHYSVENLPEGLILDVSAISSDSLRLVVKGKATAHLSSDNTDFSISLKEAAFADKTLDDVEFNKPSFSLNFRDLYHVVYVDNDDIMCSKDHVWTQLNIIPDLLGVGAWCYETVNLKLESYDNKLICNSGTSNIQLLKENVAIGANTKGWNSYDKYPNQLDLFNTSYTDWKGKEGFVGVQIEDKDYLFYAWLRISVAADGRSFKILDYAYNEEPGKAIVTGAKNMVPIKPEVEFSANKVNIYRGESILFTDESKQNPMEWIWSFEGGQTNLSQDQNPEIIYPKLGVFDVSLKATNNDGSTSLTKTDLITVYEEGPAIANFTSDKTLVKTGDIVQFTDASLRMPTSWKWTFEGSESLNSRSQNPSVTYNIPGVYQVSLVAENKFGQSIEVKEAMITVQDFSPEGYCEAKHVYDKNWLDINKVTLEQINNVSGLSEYSDFTNQIANLTVKESYNMGVSYGNNGWSSNSLYVWIDWDQSKSFEESERVFFGDNKDEDNFHNIQIDVPSDAKKGLTLMRLRSAYSNDAQPCGTINYAGEVEDYTIQVSTLEKPVAKFITDKSTIVEGEKILFSDVSDNKPTSWIWEFEGAEISSSNKSSLYVQYNNAGTYQLKLTASNSAGSDTRTESAYITVTETPETPQPDFSTSTSAVKSGELISFVNQTAFNKNATFLWTFEGGKPATSSEITPKVSYYFQGSYDVSLSVTTPEGTKTITKNNLIKVSENHKPVADFKAESLVFLTGTSVEFKDLSGNNPTSWAWEFEGADVVLSEDQNPVVTYSSKGTYKVKLTASNSFGEGVNEKLEYITVNEFIPNGYCEAKNVYDGNWLEIKNVKLGKIDNNSEVSEYSDFTSKCADLNRGSDNAMRVTYGNSWTSNSLFAWVDWDQDKNFSAEERVYFGKNTDGDGQEEFTLTVPDNALEGYTVMRLRTAYSDNSNPCGTVNYAGEVEDYTINVTNILTKPYVNFSVTNTELEKGKSVIFSNMSEENVTSVLWHFEGGSPAGSTEAKPVVTYETAGIYNVSLTVTNADGNNTELKTEYITVLEPEANHKPLNITLSGNRVAEDADLLTVIGDFKAVDEDVVDSYTFNFVEGDGVNDADNASFKIEDAVLKLNTALDFETKSEYAIYVQTEDAAGETIAVAFKVWVEDVKENLAPTNINLSASSIDENILAPTLVANLSAEDIDVEDSHTFELFAADGLVDADNDKFSIEGTKLFALNRFDFETQAQLKINLKVSDDKGNTFVKAFVIEVNDVFENSKPTSISLSKRCITENADKGVLIATLKAADVDPGEEFTFELVDEAGKISTHNEMFEIRKNELLTAAVFDFETTSLLHICIKVTDKHSESLVQEFTISVVDVDENKKPTDILLSQLIFNSDAPIGTVFADLQAVDADNNDVHRFRLYPANGLLDADNDKFILVDNHLKLNSDISNLSGKLNVNLRTTDKAGAVYTKAFMLQLKGENQAPTVPTDLVASAITKTSLHLNWNASTDNVAVTSYEILSLGNVIATSSVNSVQINNLTAGTAYRFTVRAKDAAGNVSDESVALLVNTTNEDLEAPTVPTGLVASAITQTSLNLSWNASTDNVAVTSYEVLSLGSVIATSSTNTVSISGLNANTSYNFTVRAKDARGNYSNESTILQVLTLSNISYCDASGSQGPEHIANVTFGSINNSSTRDAYRDYTAISTNVSQGNTYPISVTVGDYYNGDRATVWFDWNQDGLFNTSVEQFKLTLSGSEAKGNVLVPSNASLGNTRMRVRVHYYANAAVPCNSQTYGEVEDYTIHVLESTRPLNIELPKSSESIDLKSKLETGLQLYPNPVVDHLKIRANAIKKIKVFDVSGKLVLMFNNDGNLLEISLNFSNLKAGLYLVRIEQNNGSFITKKVIKK